MLIDKYIENALYLYQCVIVPGFGGFVATETPAEDRPDQDKYAPGRKHFAFNPLLKVNDGVLAMHIAHTRDISYAEAMDEIARAVDFYLALLEKGDTVDIEGVGSIVPEENALKFIPYGTKDFCREQYGLGSTVVEDLSQPQEDGRNRLPHAHPDVQAVPGQDTAAGQTQEDTVTAHEAGGTPAALVDDLAIETVLMEAAEKATIEKFRDNQAILRSLLASAAEKAKLSTDDPGHHQAIESIVQALAEDVAAIETTAPSPDRNEGADETAQQDSPRQTTESSAGTAAQDPQEENADPDDDTDEQPEHFWNRKAVRATVGALIVAAALAGLFFFVCRSGANLYFWKDDAPQKNAAVPPAERPDTLAAPLAGDTLAADAPQAPSLAVPSYRRGDALQTDYLADKPFYVIAAAVGVRDNASRALENLRAQGFPAEYAGYHNGLYLVAYRGFFSRAEAMEMRDSLEKTGNVDVWIKIYNRNADKKTD